MQCQYRELSFSAARGKLCQNNVNWLKTNPPKSALSTCSCPGAALGGSWLGEGPAWFSEHYSELSSEFCSSGSRASGALAGCFAGWDWFQSTGSALAPLKGNAHTSGFVCVCNIKAPSRLASWFSSSLQCFCVVFACVKWAQVGVPWILKPSESAVVWLGQAR